jgi:hypothetical protein
MTIEKTTVFETMESKGLGIAPFNCTGVYSIPAATTDNIELYNRQIKAMPSDIGIGSCACCGMNLTHNYLIQSSDGRKFVLGSSCVEKLGQGQVVTEMEKTKKRLNSRIRRIKKIAKDTLKLEDYISILNRPVETWPIGSGYYNSGIMLVADSTGKDMRYEVICFHPIRQKTGKQSSYTGFNYEDKVKAAMEFIARCEKGIAEMAIESEKLKGKSFK